MTAKSEDLSFNPELCRNETEVESKLIVQYLLPQLGYSPDSWFQEVSFGSIRLDFLAFAAQVFPFSFSNSPLSLVIEAKSPNKSLDQFVRRLRQYLNALESRYGLLTNGKELRIYERFGDQVRLIFKCSGKDIIDRIAEIKAIIGKESIKGTQLRDKVAQDIKKGDKPVKIIAIYHNKGGVGKTTVSVNLAAALRKKRYKVLLIDIDSQANSTFATGLIKFQFEEDDNLKEKNILHVLKSGDFDFIQDISRISNFFNTPEIDVVPSHISLIDGQYELNQRAVSKTRLIKKLKHEEEKYDFVIIDTPPSRDIYAQVALIAADYLIIPSDLKPFANQGLSSVQSFIKENNEFRESLSKQPLEVMGVLPSKISTNTKAFNKTFPRQKETILKHYNLPVMDSIIFDRTALSHCFNQNISIGDLEVPDPKSIFDYADKNPEANKSAEEFENLANEVLDKMEKI